MPGVQNLRRRFVFNYGESLTAMIRNPKTLGRVGRLRSSLFMRWQLRDPELRRKVWPDYTFGCKRVLFSSLFLPALARSNVELVDDPITAVTPKGVVTASGLERDADCIIWGTGFRTNDFMFPMRVTGADGTDLEQAWEAGAHAHLGMAVPGFPSMFVMYGPNTNTSGGSIIFYLEAQAAYIRQALEQAASRGAAIAVRPEVEAASDRGCRRALPAPPGRNVTRGIATSTAASSPTGPATCASTPRQPPTSIPPSTSSSKPGRVRAKSEPPRRLPAQWFLREPGRTWGSACG